jgi:LemA protein
VIVLWIVLGIIVVIGVALVMSYNRFVKQRNLIRNSWANIDTELRRRYDLIPNLVETVKGYAAHEREVFEEVARTRSAAAGTTGTPAAQAAAEGPFVAALGKLFAVAENYPELKANQNFLALQQELSNTEDRIQASRRFYNANVQQFNSRVQSFPSNVIAGMFGFKEEQFFEIPEAERAQVAEAPHVDFGAPAAAPVAPTAPPAAPPVAAPPAPPPAAPAPPPPAGPPEGAPPSA